MNDIVHWLTVLFSGVSLLGAAVVFRRLGKSATGVLLASGLGLYGVVEAGWAGFWYGYFIPASRDGLTPALESTRLTAMVVSWLGYTVVALLLAVGVFLLPRQLRRLRKRSAVRVAVACE